jgi:hypothetical protein
LPSSQEFQPGAKFESSGADRNDNDMVQIGIFVVVWVENGTADTRLGRGSSPRIARSSWGAPRESQLVSPSQLRGNADASASAAPAKSNVSAT